MGDIKRYLYGHMSDWTTSAQKTPDMQEAIANSIVDVVDGMFLVARLHVDSSTDKRTLKLSRKL